ncbi:PEGA domain-containing protein [Hyalangium versicolor]|uniref:PEGA domain-containing protein n=1 Tax=Hyalangium versicolor TaxID=2861190 RepID=UPI001CCD50FF|nr:PEGA domain-containing protein [Hyalangium versicolor]
MSTFRLFLVLALALSVSAEAQSARRGKKKPAPVVKPEPKSKPEPAPEPTVAQPEPEPTPAPPVRKAVENGTVVFAIARSSNAESAASQIQEALTRELSSKPDVQMVDLGSAFPPPPPVSLKEADALYEQGKESYDNLDPETAAAKFNAAADAYEKHPGAFKPQQLARTFVFLGACEFLNGDKPGAKNAFLRALAADPLTQPDHNLFGSDVQTAFTDAQQEFNAQKPGTLVVESKPSGAQVTVRGEDVGLTPLKGVEVHPGRQPVVISLPGYQPYASYPQVASGKNSELKPQLEPLPELAQVLAAAAKASSAKAFDGDAMPPEVASIADKVGARYVVLAAVQQKKGAEAEVQVWDVRTKNRLRGVELKPASKERTESPQAAAERVHGFLTGKLVAEPSSPLKGLPPVVKKPWFWAAVVGGAAVVTGGIVYATQARRGGPLGPVSGLPGLGF